MNIKDLHRQAIVFMKAANSAKELGDKNGYNSLLEQAFNLEKEAAEKLKDNLTAEPTRSVLYRSAANLAVALKQFVVAKELALEGLRGNPYTEIAKELQNVIDKTKLDAISFYPRSVSTETDNKRQDIYHIDNVTDYVINLRAKALEFRIKESSDKYGGAVRLSHAIDFLNNVQSSYSNYADIKFRRTYKVSDKNRKDEALANKFRKNSNLLAVDLNFKSFGISIAADDGLMDHIGIHNKDITNMHNILFDEFKNDVILPDYNNSEFQKLIEQKFTPDERKRIFSPILKTVNNNHGYSLSLTENEYSKEIKRFRPLNSSAQTILSPDLETPKEVEASLIKTVSQKIGGKKKILVAEDLKKAEFDKTVNDIKFKDKIFNFRTPFQLIIKFDSGKFSIVDEKFEIDVYAGDGQEIFDIYSKEFIEKYSYFLNNLDKLSIEEKNILDQFETLGIRNW